MTEPRPLDDADRREALRDRLLDAFGVSRRDIGVPAAAHAAELYRQAQAGQALAGLPYVAPMGDASPITDGEDGEVGSA